MRPEILEACARLAHEANRAYCFAIGDYSQQPWGDAEEWKRDASRDMISKVLNGESSKQIHDQWCDGKIKSGWVYGPIKDGELRTHPCLIPYAELPREQQRKDALFQAVVTAMSQALSE